MAYGKHIFSENPNKYKSKKTYLPGVMTTKSLASGTGSWESNELGESKIAGEL